MVSVKSLDIHKGGIPNLLRVKTCLDYHVLTMMKVRPLSSGKMLTCTHASRNALESTGLWPRTHPATHQHTQACPLAHANTFQLYACKRHLAPKTPLVRSFDLACHALLLRRSRRLAQTPHACPRCTLPDTQLHTHA